MPSISGFLSRYFGHEKPKPPPITTTTAVALLVLYTLVYVVPFYLSPLTRPSATLTRDAPSVIKARVRSVSLTCIICSVSTLVILTSQGRTSNVEALHSMGYWPVGLTETARSLLLTAVLFAGPLFETLVVEGGWRAWRRLEPVTELWQEWTTWRNIIAGPLTEEVLFRSAAVPLMLLAQTSVTKTIFLSPVVFGLAHLHHFYEFRLTHPQVPVAAAALRSLFQLAFTSLFGAYATFLYLRTGSLLAIFAVHAFCNCMGLPRFWGRVEPPAARTGGGDGKSGASTMWTAIYYALLLAGAWLWWRNLGTLTKSPNELIPIQM